jgi:multiple antibiotic resistance protein
MTPLLADAVKLVTLVFGALVSIINPPGSVPIFLAMTAGCSTALRHALARQIAVNVFVILVVSMFVGSHILDFFGLSLPVVQVGGGLLITAIGWQLLNQREDAPIAPTAGSVTPDQMATRAFYPLTLPLTVGPGSISVAITLGVHTSRSGILRWALVLSMAVGVALVALATYFSYRYAEGIARLLGQTGTSVFFRLSAFIAVCIGVQITWNGVSALVGPLISGAPVGAAR